MGLYNDLFVRDNFGDNGNEPVTDSYVSGSPDIIPYAQDTLTQSELISNYGPPLLNKAIQANQLNNIYVRAKNNYNGASNGKIYLYYAPPNILINISSWKNNIVPNNNGNLYAVANATTKNQITPGDQPFSFTPSAALGSHFCFLVRVATNHNSNPLPSSDFASWGDFVNWIRNNAWAAWHNVNVVNTLPAKGYIGNVIFHNINNQSEFYGFRCNYKNIPAGSKIRMYAMASSNFSGFDSGEVVVSGNGAVAQGAEFPANYQTTVFVTCQFPGNPTTPPPNATITVESLGYVPSATPEDWEKHKSYNFTPEELEIETPEYDDASSGMFVQITSYNILF